VAESFTASFPSSGWDSDPYSLKNLGDLILVQGVNRLIFHNTVHQPWKNFTPGMTMGPHGIQMNRGNTWFKQSAAWLSHLSRSSFLLQQGQFIGDICYYFGEDVPSNLRISEEIDPLPPEGYDYDALATEFVMQFKVKNGQLILPGGMAYSVLVLPNFVQTMRPEVVQKIHDLVQAGATVVSPKPKKSPGLTNYPDCDTDVEALADKVWGNIDGRKVTSNSFGKGRMYWGKPLEQVLADLKVPADFTYTGKDEPDLKYIHRQIDGEDMYFISNQTQRYTTVECSFRCIGTPERWQPETAAIEDVAMYRQENGRTSIPMLLAPAESLFIIFKKGKKNSNWVTGARLNNKNILETHTRERSELSLLEARYGILGDTAKTMDVMEEVSARIHQGQLDIIPCRHIKSDPEPSVPDRSKQLFIKYRLDGKVQTKTISYASRVVIPAQPGGFTLHCASLHRTGPGAMFLKAWEAGNYQLQLADGKTKTISVDSVPQPKKIEGPWTVKFPAGWGAPPEVTFDHLISWTEHSHFDIKHFSGTATYEKELLIPEGSLKKGHLLYLDLGKVKNIAEVTVNGKDLGV